MLYLNRAARSSGGMIQPPMNTQPVRAKQPQHKNAPQTGALGARQMAAALRAQTPQPAQQQQNAKTIDYKVPGSVAKAHGWNYANIAPQAKSYLSGGEPEHQRNMRSHVDKFLGKNYGLNYAQISSAPNNNNLSQLVNAMDYAFREEARKQQTKSSGLLGGILGAGLSLGLGAINPALGVASGLAQSKGNPAKIAASFVPGPKQLAKYLRA